MSLNESNCGVCLLNYKIKMNPLSKTSHQRMNQKANCGVLSPFSMRNEIKESAYHAKVISTF